MIIYKITNLITNSVYIGKTNNFNRRMIEHFSVAFNPNSDEYNKMLSKKIREYGKDNFKAEIIETCLDEEWEDREKYYISLYNSFKGKGYNQTEGGDGVAVEPMLKDDIDDIIELLESSDLSQAAIAIQFNCSDATISNINNGLLLKQDDKIYPIRVNNIEHLHNTIYDKLQNTNDSFRKIALSLNVAESTIKKMNYGTLNKKDNLCYPIRKISGVKAKALAVKELLLESNYSYTEIAELTETSIRTVGRINNGETHRDSNLHYPLRPAV